MDYVRKVRELERENEILKWRYVPNVGDAIDEALARFTNSRPEGNKMKMRHMSFSVSFHFWLIEGICDN